MEGYLLLFWREFVVQELFIRTEEEENSSVGVIVSYQLIQVAQLSCRVRFSGLGKGNRSGNQASNIPPPPRKAQLLD
jgi:hypothetical protein